jgi:predicted nucleotidyltransferase
MINDDILAIEDTILKTVKENCEQIYLFGSYADGTPRIGGDNPSDYDLYVVLNDDTKTLPIVVIQDIRVALIHGPKYYRTDILANYKSHFIWRSKEPTIENTVVEKGVLLFDRSAAK